MVLVMTVDRLPSREELDAASLGRVVLFVESIRNGGARLSDKALLDRARFMEDAANRLARGITDRRSFEEADYVGPLNLYYQPPGGEGAITSIPDEDPPR